MKPKFVFFGTPRFGAQILEKLITANLKPQVVITTSDKPMGRHYVSTPSPVKQIAQKHHLPVLTPEWLDKKFLTSSLKLLTSDFFLLAAYGKIIPPEFLSLPKYGALNIHPSFLPKYRGPSPIQTALLDNAAETGVTIFLMDEKIDHGLIIAQEKLAIKPHDTSETLSQKLARLGASLAIRNIEPWLEKKIKPRPQDDSQATYTKVLTRQDGYFELDNPPKNLKNMIRAFYLWPGVHTKLNLKSQKSKILKFLPGNKLQLEGKKPVSFEEFLKGYPELKPKLERVEPLLE